MDLSLNSRTRGFGLLVYLVCCGLQVIDQTWEVDIEVVAEMPIANPARAARFSRSGFLQ